MSITICAPGKLILSGEHAVVYGHPALAMAVDRYVSATACADAEDHISFNLTNLSYRHQLSIVTLEDMKERIKKNYQRFVNGDFKIRDVLQKPFELAQFVFGLFFEMLNIKLTQGISIHVESTIPMGCGMGSSAATVISIMHAIAKHLKIEMPPEQFLQLGKEAESMQHGYSSGLDLQMSLHGGCVYTHAGQMHARAIPTIKLYLVNTGTPLSTTGQCIESAADYFKTSTIGNDFAAVTIAFDKALAAQNISAIGNVIRANHQLLIKIGVVPTKVQNFIASIEKQNGAAKICGAGAVVGNNAGVVLVVTQDEEALRELCEQYHYSLLPITGESRGVHLV